jgi:acyl-CoA thioester hydrolase
MLVYNFELRVQYFETDQMHYVHHGRYIEYFERARTEMLRDFGLPYSEIEEMGYFMPVKEVGITYQNPAFYEDMLVVECKVNGANSPVVRIDHKIYKKESGTVVVEGFVKLVFVNRETKRVSKPPLAYTEMMKKLLLEYENAE